MKDILKADEGIIPVVGSSTIKITARDIQVLSILVRLNC